MRLHVGTKGLRSALALVCCLSLGGGLSGCVSKGKYERALAANQACQQRVSQQEQRLNQLHASLMDAHMSVTGQAANPNMTDEELVAVLRSSLSERDAELARYRGEEENALTYQLLAKYLFPSGSANLTPQGREALNKVATWLKESEANNIFVQGFTDDVPIGKSLKRKYASNWELSAHRATTVVRFLVDQGVPEDRLIAVGYGDKHPEADGGDEMARQQNRRIEIKLNNGQFKEVVARIPGSVPATALIDINRASATELTLLPGMSPELARSVVDYRARAGGFSSFEDLQQVRGFDAQKMEPIKSMISFGDQGSTDFQGTRSNERAIPDSEKNRIETEGMERTDTQMQYDTTGTSTGGASSGATTGSSDPYVAPSTDTQRTDTGGTSSGATTGSTDQQRTKQDDTEKPKENMYLVPKENTESYKKGSSGSPKNTYPQDNTGSDVDR